MVNFDAQDPDILIHLAMNTPTVNANLAEVIKNPFSIRQMMHPHNCYVLVYAPDGDNTEIVEETVLPMSGSDLVLLSPNTSHSNFARDPASRVVFFNILPAMVGQTILPLLDENIVFSSFFSEFLADSATCHYLVLHNAVTPAVRQLLDGMIDEFVARQPFFQARLRISFANLLIELARNPEATHLREESDPRLTEILSYIARNSTHATLEETAAHFGYHPSYFSGLIRSSTGKTFQQLKLEHRMVRAAALLKQPELPVEQVALQCGYGDKASFYKAYKKYYGKSPRS